MGVLSSVTVGESTCGRTDNVWACIQLSWSVRASKWVMICKDNCWITFIRTCVAVTGRKRTLFQCKWQVVISLECFKY